MIHDIGEPDPGRDSGYPRGRSEQDRLILLAFLACTVLPVLLGVVVLFRKVSLERAAIDPARRK